jgi:glycerol-3-phosphate dehydrogenase (NAD(P)+)
MSEASMSHVAVVGAGAWGTALSLVLAERGDDVRLWTWQAAHALELERDRENKAFFPGYALPPAVRISADLGAVVDGAALVLVVVPTTAYRETLARLGPLVPASCPIVTCSKGIEVDSQMLLSEVLESELGAEVLQRSLYLSGPSFADEVARRLPTNVVLAGFSFDLSVEVQQRIATDRFRVYSSDDPIGVQVGGALKNVIAIAAGACDGLGFGYNTRAALITRGLAEMARLAVEKGGQEHTLAGLSGLGDLVLTCTGELSRNRTLGFELGRGKELAAVERALGHVAEGVVTAKSAYHLAERLGVDLPISSEVYRVLYEHKPVSEAVRDVLGRPLRRE